MASFIDRVVLHLEAGKGGNGAASVRRESSSRSVAQMAPMVGMGATSCSVWIPRKPPCWLFIIRRI